MKHGEHAIRFRTSLISRLILDVYDVYGRREGGMVKMEYCSCFSSRHDDVTFEYISCIDDRSKFD